VLTNLVEEPMSDIVSITDLDSHAVTIALRRAVTP